MIKSVRLTQNMDVASVGTGSMAVWCVSGNLSLPRKAKVRARATVAMATIGNLLILLWHLICDAAPQSSYTALLYGTIGLHAGQQTQCMLHDYEYIYIYMCLCIHTYIYIHIYICVYLQAHLLTCFNWSVVVAALCEGGDHLDALHVPLEYFYPSVYA